MMSKELAKSYNPKDFEDRIYKYWNDSGCFKAEIDENKKPYTIVIPPPNITGQLHMGHALDETLQDILIRYKRMSGYSALWLPGTDHASIATEAKIVEAMKKDGADQRGHRPRRFYGTCSGNGKSSTAAESLNSLKSWALHATGPENALLWTRAVTRL